MDQAGKDRAAAYVVEQMARKGWSAAFLALQAGLDEGTVRTFINGERWPWATKRGQIEKALGLGAGTLELVARGIDQKPREEEQGDPVEAAIRRSALTRANQHKLIGTYYEMLDEQQREVRGA